LVCRSVAAAQQEFNHFCAAKADPNFGKQTTRRTSAEKH